MKILGIGVDLVANKRMENILSKSFNQRFLSKVLHAEEIRVIESHADLKKKS